MTVKLFYFRFRNKKILDTWFRWGQANHRGKVVACGFACESLIVIYLTILANSVSRLCTSRSAFQIACLDPNCLNCAPGYVDCTCLLKMHCAAVVAYEFILQMPSSRRHDILSDGNGLFFASDMDWKAFHRDGAQRG